MIKNHLVRQPPFSYIKIRDKFLAMINSFMYVIITASTGSDNEPKKTNKIRKIFS